MSSNNKKQNQKPEPKQLLRYYRDAGVEETIGNEPRSYLGTGGSARPKPGKGTLSSAVLRGAKEDENLTYVRHGERSVAIQSGGNANERQLENNVPTPSGKPSSASEAALDGHGATLAMTNLACQSTTTQAEAEAIARQLADMSNTREELKAAVEQFQGCQLKFTAMNTVFSDGNAAAKVMVIGEAPGANEDLQGIPFCGESGQLLDKVLGTIGLTRRDSLYISNVVFWRPPANRKPTDDELRSCLPFVERHIALINPKLLIIAGSVALSSLFPAAGTISRCRQMVMSYTNRYLQANVPTVAIFHPSYLLRQPLQKKSAWLDMLFVARLLDGVN